MIHFGKPPPQKFNDLEPIPAGEVTEGNEESDWAAWEDSVLFQDSQLADPQPPATSAAKTKPVDPSFEHVDIFSTVHKNSA